jgi:hypothetical protein
LLAFVVALSVLGTYFYYFLPAAVLVLLFVLELYSGAGRSAFILVRIVVFHLSRGII